MFEILFLAAMIVGFFIFQKGKVIKHPIRLIELGQALRTHADLRLYRNKDTDTAARLNRIADHLQTAQHLINSPNESMRQEWNEIRPSLTHSASEEILRTVDLYYSERRDEVKAAVYDLVSRLDKAYERKKGVVNTNHYRP